MARSKPSFTVETEGKLIVITVVGRQSAAAVQEIRRQVEVRLAAKHGPKDILVNINRADIPNRKSLMASLVFLREVPFRRIAVFGNKPNLMLVVGSLLKLSGGTNEHFKIFRSENLARDWLKQAHHPIRTKLKQQGARLLNRRG
jgi:hypothetical protein